MVALEKAGDRVTQTTIELGPEWKDDPLAAELYQSYLSRVSRENLLEKFPRTSTASFVGSAKCGSCHAEAYRTWQLSGHAHALATLEREGNGRDPECLPCHVIGLKSVHGYRSRLSTPLLGVVGCESCHGEGTKHSAAPKRSRIAKSGREICITCHTLGNSPTFNFLTYWPKIKHR